MQRLVVVMLCSTNASWFQLVVAASAATLTTTVITVQVTVGGRGRFVTITAAATTALRLTLLFHLQLLAKDGGDLALHKGPRYRRVSQRTLFATWTVHLSTRALSFDALTAAGEAELVMTH